MWLFIKNGCVFSVMSNPFDCDNDDVFINPFGEDIGGLVDDPTASLLFELVCPHWATSTLTQQVSQDCFTVTLLGETNEQETLFQCLVASGGQLQSNQEGQEVGDKLTKLTHEN